jgi:hypothetical protein
MTVVQSVRLPIRLHSLQNMRWHWATKAKIIKGHREAAYLACRREDLPITVRVTRYGPRKMDRDNNISSMKGLIDGIAQRLQADDGDERITWIYEQGIAKGYSVTVEFIRE